MGPAEQFRGCGDQRSGRVPVPGLHRHVDPGGIADEETIRCMLVSMEGEDWVQDDDDSEEEFPEWLGLTI